jgi:hypothetical protein
VNPTRPPGSSSRWIANGRAGNRTSPPSVGGGRLFTVNDEGAVSQVARFSLPGG